MLWGGETGLLENGTPHGSSQSHQLDLRSCRMGIVQVVQIAQHRGAQFSSFCNKAERNK